MKAKHFTNDMQFSALKYYTMAHYRQTLTGCIHMRTCSNYKLKWINLDWSDAGDWMLRMIWWKCNSTWNFKPTIKHKWKDWNILPTAAIIQVIFHTLKIAYQLRVFVLNGQLCLLAETLGSTMHISKNK